MLLRRPWTHEEEQALRSWAANISVNRIAIRLKRSPSAVKSRALELGLSLRTRGKASRANATQGPQQAQGPQKTLGPQKEPRSESAGRSH